MCDCWASKCVSESVWCRQTERLHVLIVVVYPPTCRVVSSAAQHTDPSHCILHLLRSLSLYYAISTVAMETIFLLLSSLLVCVAGKCPKCNKIHTPTYMHANMHAHTDCAKVSRACWVWALGKTPITPRKVLCVCVCGMCEVCFECVIKSKACKHSRSHKLEIELRCKLLFVTLKACAT